MKKQKQIDTSFFNHPLSEAYLNLSQDAFKHNKIGLPWNELRLYTYYTCLILLIHSSKSKIQDNI